MSIRVGLEISAGTGQKITVLDYCEKNDVILALFENSGEPFVVIPDYTIENDYIRWSGARYRSTLTEAMETFLSLAHQSRRRALKRKLEDIT